MPQYLYRIRPTRPAMLTDAPTEQEESIIGQHFHYLQGLLAEGVVLMAGRTLTADERAFGIVIIAAASEAAAADVVQNDPAVRHGIMTADLFPYRVALWSPTGPKVDDEGD